jgi:putative transposase
LIGEADRSVAVELIDEAVDSGARCFKACEVLEVSVRTYQRWKRDGYIDRRKGASRTVRRKLSEEERQEILDQACSERFRDCTPYEIVAILAQEGTYLASVSTFYRVLRAAGKLHHRGESRPAHHHNAPPELIADGPNQVFSWDITYLKTAVSGIFLYAYLIIDVWSRKIIGWAVEAEESEGLAVQLFRSLVFRLGLRGVRLHSDNGHPMKGATILMTLYHLGVIPSFSRPRVSDDNPYSESLFKTLKYTVGYPKHFKDLTHAREWMASFIDWYNTKHLHSSIGYVTPQQRHDGSDMRILESRNRTIEAAYKKHPERWSKLPKRWKAPSIVYLNPTAETRKSIRENTA